VVKSTLLRLVVGGVRVVGLRILVATVNRANLRRTKNEYY
jgi:hypothetical protein